MLSVRTLQNVVRIQNLGNISGVDPIKMNPNSAGVVENCKVIYSGKYWKMFMIFIILARIFFGTLGIILSVVLKETMNSADKAFLFLLLLTDYMVCIILLHNIDTKPILTWLMSNE